LAVGLAVTLLLAIPVAWLLVTSSSWFGRFERARASVFLGVAVANPHRPIEGRLIARLRRQLTTAVTWKEIGYHLVGFPVAVAGFTIVVSAWSGALTLLVAPALAPVVVDNTYHFWFFDLEGWWTLLCLPAGLVALVLSAYLALGWGALSGALVRALLGPSTTEALTERVSSLETTRALAVDAAEEERRRIERDLHDGAQQRLVALSMDIGMAKAKFESDPLAARALLDEAHDESKRAIAELRSLARGIHPVALTDRGLPGAIPGLAARAPLPVEVAVDVDERPAPAIEGIAYFIVSEALTNIAKHAQATSARVAIVRQSASLSVEITDNGRGGAQASAGSGLRGLADRVASVDGEFSVSSPIGGPTVIRADLPCGVTR
jgi:signal transduction histidine kinase